MGFGVVGHLIAHARRQHERAAIGKLGVQFAFEAQQDVALAAPPLPSPSASASRSR